MNKSPEQNRVDILNELLYNEIFGPITIRKPNGDRILYVQCGTRKYLKSKIDYIYWHQYCKSLNKTVTVFYDKYGFGWSDSGTIWRKRNSSDYFKTLLDKTLLCQLAYTTGLIIRYNQKDSTSRKWKLEEFHPNDLNKDIETLHIFINQSF